MYIIVEKVIVKGNDVYITTSKGKTEIIPKAEILRYAREENFDDNRFLKELDLSIENALKDSVITIDNGHISDIIEDVARLYN